MFEGVQEYLLKDANNVLPTANYMRMFPRRDAGALLQGRALLAVRTCLFPPFLYRNIIDLSQYHSLADSRTPAFVAVGIGIQQYWISDTARLTITVAHIEMGDQNKLAP